MTGPRRRTTRRLLIAAALLILGPLVAAPGWAAEDSHGAAASPRPLAVPLDQLSISSTQVASGLQRPTAIAAPDDGSNRLFITEKVGTVRVYNPSSGLVATPLIDITGSVDNSGNERGLLGIATPPNFATSQVLYLAYTARTGSGDVTLARYSLATRRLQPLITQEHTQFPNHNGGQLTFGPDGFLYWSIGDGGGSGDPFNSGQALNTLLGKIMRIDVSRTCGTLPYCIPASNPFVGQSGRRGEIWAYGLRNPWRFSFDRANGEMWIGDVGQGQWEEVNHVPAGRAGANYGWSCREGLVTFDQTQCPSNTSSLTNPVYTYPTSVNGSCAVTGGYVYRGQQYADLVGGTYIGADYCSSTVFALRPTAGGGYEQATIGTLQTQVSSFGQTVAGELYYVNDLPGGLHRISFGQTG